MTISPSGDPERVVLDPPGLDPAEAAPAPTVVRAMSLTVSSTTRRSNHHRNAATRPPITMKSRWFRSSNHHLFSDAR